MRYKVIFLNSAEHDLIDLRAYILNNFSTEVWLTTYTNIKKVVRNLQKFPFAGSTLPEKIKKLNLTQYRQILSGMNRIIYEVRQDTIYIHIIVDARRDFNALLMRRLLR